MLSSSPAGNDVEILRKGVPDTNNPEECYSDCGSHASSQTSTDLYSHKPFETFIQKVHSLLATIFPNDLPIKMEHMTGGSFNRVMRGVLSFGQQW